MADYPIGLKITQLVIVNKITKYCHRKVGSKRMEKRYILTGKNKTEVAYINIRCNSFNEGVYTLLTGLVLRKISKLVCK